MLLYHTFTIISIFEKRFDRIFLHFGEKRRGRKKEPPVGGSERNRKRSLSREGSDLFGDTAGEDL